MSFLEVKESKLKGVTWLCPIDEDKEIELLEEPVRPMTPFSEESLTFLDDLHRLLRDHPLKRVYPEISTFAFFCRRSNLIQMREPYEYELGNRLGRGRVFHITPSNVPMNFAYSMVSALLAGNSSILRISSKEVEQVDIVIEAINELLHKEEHTMLQSYIQIIRYGREYSNNTAVLSSLCDIRVIWGGDQSIQDIRQAMLPANAFDITFADRISLAVINSSELRDIDKLVQGFYNDTYLNDQNACTSPFLVVWVGDTDETDVVKGLFWNRLEELVQENYSLNEISGVDKLATFMQHSVDSNGELKTSCQTNALWRVKVEEYNLNVDNHRCNSGYFLEIDVEDLNDLLPQLSRNYQTLSYYGFEKQDLLQTLRVNKSPGIDRIVPIGRTQEFSLNWDGYDLIRSMSRIIA